MIRGLNSRPNAIESIVARYLSHPYDFRNNQRLLQVESLVPETVDFDARQVLNFAITSQLVTEYESRQKQLQEELEL